ncbi:Polyphosphate kinase [Methanosarcina mazei Tuc01]|uniref:ATP-polyphosphate phosphotransferase n=1 Tax=Methanosarcina mazei Tuc01 TaxID=1236903 RepID=M1Q3E8_METMZ|nr:Polyphosphate kinase [Methanosarcina mazei Tuc01]
MVTDSVEGTRVEVSGMPDLSDPCFYADREYSWLQFNARVLEEALDERNPLLERVKFLSIFGSNLDEFFMVRVSGVQKRITEGIKEDCIDEVAQEQLRVIREELLRQLPINDSCWNEILEPALRENGIEVLNYFELSGEDREKLRDYFERNIFPLLTPLGFDSGHPFPHISNLSLNLAVLIDDPEYGERFARVKIPPMFSRLIVVPEGKQEKIISSFEELKTGRFVWLEQLIAANLDLLFPGQRILGAYPFRITRDADLGFDEDGDKDLLTAVKQRVGRNYFGPAVRLETDYTMPEKVSDILLKNLDLTRPLMFRSAAPLGLSSLMKLAQIDRPELKYEPFEQKKHPRMADRENKHSRIYYFRNGGKEEIFLGSADLMPRNLDNRVEVLFPVSQDYIPVMRDIILGIHLKDNVKARLLLPNGRTERIYPQPEEEELDSQVWMLENRGSWDIKTER